MEANIQANRDLHKRIGQLFGSTMTPQAPPPTNAQYQNLQDLNACNSLANENAHFYLPPGEDSKNVEIKKVEVTTEYCGNQPLINYQIQWIEKTKMVPKGPEKPRDEMIFMRNSPGNDSTDSESSSYEEPTPLVKKTSSMMKIPGNGRCDGPCGKIVDLSTTVQFGCDHVICDVCRRKCPSAALFDGSPGCCNPTCVEIAKANGERLCSGQLSESGDSVISRAGTVESVPTHISILKNFGKDVLRTQLEYEYPTSSRLSIIRKSLVHYKDLFDNSRFYYCTHKPRHRKDLTPIDLLNTNQRFYDIVDMKAPPILYVIIVGKDIKFFDKN